MSRFKYFFYIGLILFLIYILVEPFLLRTTQIEFYDNDIPGVFNNKKIVFVSDIHHGPFFSRNRVRNLVKKINKLKPDIIILGGDYVHQDSKYIIPVFAELKKLKAKHGKFGVLGNHDHWEGAQLSRKSMKNADIKLIDNKGDWIIINSQKIKIAGVGDFYEDNQDIETAVGDTKEEDFVILVSHNPDFAEYINDNNVDLLLSGHTHGGQFTLFGLFAPLLPSQNGQKYRTGIVKTPFTTVIISNGVGTISPPVRFFARPEIILITIHNKKGV